MPRHNAHPHAHADTPTAHVTARTRTIAGVADYVAIIALALALALATGTTRAQETDTRLRVDRQAIEPVTSTHGMVVSDTPLATAIGAEVLARGGSAADAAVAVAVALAVTWPEAGNLAGGGFMMIADPRINDIRDSLGPLPGHDRPATSTHVICLDYREVAPAAATPDMFADKTTRFWHGQVGVPGTVAGLAKAHEIWGRLPWADLIQPSIELAREGLEVNEALALSINAVLNKSLVRREPERFTELLRVYGHPDARDWQAGDRLVLPDLANTLQTLADQGPDAFYQGSIANAIADDMAANDGLITTDDLAHYRPVIRPAIHTPFADADVFGPPPPSAGGLTLAMTLNQLDAQRIGRTPDTADRFAPATLHLMAEAMRRAYHYRALKIADSDYVHVPFEIATPAFGELLATTIDPVAATPSHTLRPDIPLADQPESRDTTHFSVIDAQGLAIANTYTLEMSWGSRMMTPGTGLILNNQMGDFNRQPGVTKTTGQIGTPPNTIEPGKRMLSSQTPTIVQRDGRTILLVGSPGGRTITNTVANILVSTLAYDIPLSEAVDAPRMHHQWFRDEIEFEAADQPGYEALTKALRELGHTVVNDGRQGSANCIAIDPHTHTYTGVPDWRRGAAAAAPKP